MKLKKGTTCGKEFYPAALHIYRKKNKWYCCYSCYNKDEGNGKSKK